MSGHANSTRAIIFALGANFAIFVAKGFAALVTGSSAMLAEAIHSLADCSNQVLLLIGLRQARRPVSPEHPLGWGKVVYFWSFLVAILLFSVGGMFSIYEGIHKLQHPEPLKQAWIAVLVLSFGIAAEMVSFRACLQEVNKVREGRSYLRWFRMSRSSELIVIFGEDLAALLGLVLALVAVLLAWVTGNPMFDAMGTLCIGILLLVVALMVAREVKELLVGQSVEPVQRKRIHDFFAARPEIEETLHVITLQMGSDVMLAVKARMREKTDAAKLLADINVVESELRQAFPAIRWSFFEPDDND